MSLVLGDMLVRFGADLTDFQAGLQAIEGQLSKLQSTFSSAGSALSIAFTVPLALIEKYAISAFAGFEQSMSKVEALSDASRESMAKLEQQALDLGKQTQYSAKQAADAMGDLAAAGFNANQIFEAMPQVLALAATEHMKIADAAQISASVLKGFGLAITDLAGVTDILAKTGSSSAASITSLGSSFQYIGPIAKAANQSFLDISTALGVLAQAGIKGESAGTALRNLFSDLTKPSLRARDAMKTLGIVVADVHGNMKPLTEILKALSPLVNNNSAGFAIFGQRFSDVLPLLNKGGKDFADMRKEIELFGGSAEKMRKIMQNNLAGDWENFTGSVETAAIQAGKALEPFLKAIVKWAQSIVDKLGDVIAKFKELPVAIQELSVGGLISATLAGPALVALGALTKVIDLAVLGLRGLIGMFVQTATAADGTSTSVLGLSKVLQKGLVIGVVIFAIEQAIETFKSLKAAGQEVSDMWKTLAGTEATKEFRADLDQLKKLVGDLFNKIDFTPLSNAFTSIEGQFVNLGKTIAKAFDYPVITSFISKIGELGSLIGNDIATKFGAVKWLIQTIGEAWNNINWSRSISDSVPLFGNIRQIIRDSVTLMETLLIMATGVSSTMQTAADKKRKEIDNNSNNSKDKKALEKSAGYLETQAQYVARMTAVTKANEEAAASVDRLTGKTREGAKQTGDANQVWGRHKHVVDEAAKAYEALQAIIDRVRDLTERLPKTLAEANAQYVKGANFEKQYESLLEAESDLTRRIEKEYRQRMDLANKAEDSITQQKLTDLAIRTKAEEKGQVLSLDMSVQYMKKLALIYNDGGEQIKRSLELGAKELKPVSDSLLAGVKADAIAGANAVMLELQKALSRFPNDPIVGLISGAAQKLGVAFNDAFFAGTTAAFNFNKEFAKAEKSLQEAYDIVQQNRGLFTNQELLQAEIGFLTGKVKLEQDYLDKSKLLYKDFNAWWVQQFGISLQKAQAGFDSAIQDFNKALSKGVAGGLSALIIGDLDGAKKALDVMIGAFEKAGQKMLLSLMTPITDLVDGAIARLQDALTPFLAKLGGKLLDALWGGGNGVGTAIAKLSTQAIELPTTVGKAMSEVAFDFQNLTTAASESAKAAGLAGQAATSAATASSSVANSATQVTGALGGVSKGVGSFVSSIGGMVNMISGIVSAVTGVLSYISQRRMEQDLARIEVTTRSIFNTIGNSGDSIAIWSKRSGMGIESIQAFLNGSFHDWFASLMSTAEEIRDILKAGGLGGSGGGVDWDPFFEKLHDEFKTLLNGMAALFGNIRPGYGGTPTSYTLPDQVQVSSGDATVNNAGGTTYADFAAAVDKNTAAITTYSAAAPLEFVPNAPEAVKKGTETLVNAVDAAGQGTQQAFSGFADTVTTSSANLATATNDAAQAINGAVGDGFLNPLDSLSSRLTQLQALSDQITKQMGDGPLIPTDFYYQKLLQTKQEMDSLKKDALALYGVNTPSALLPTLPTYNPPGFRDNGPAQLYTGPMGNGETLGGTSPLTFNFYGVTDPAKMADSIVTGMRTRGVNL